jgi:hypothetical protein
VLNETIHHKKITPKYKFGMSSDRQIGIGTLWLSKFWAHRQVEDAQVVKKPNTD